MNSYVLYKIYYVLTILPYYNQLEGLHVCISMYVWLKFASNTTQQHARMLQAQSLTVLMQCNDKCVVNDPHSTKKNYSIDHAWYGHKKKCSMQFVTLTL